MRAYRCIRLQALVGSGHRSAFHDQLSYHAFLSGRISARTGLSASRRADKGRDGRRGLNNAWMDLLGSNCLSQLVGGRDDFGRRYRTETRARLGSHSAKLVRKSHFWLYAPSAPDFATGLFVVGNTGFFAFIGSRHPIELFLERDSSTNLLGIQTFPAVCYIQPSVVTTRSMEECSAWITRVEYDVGAGNFALEFGERFPLPWSKATGGNDFVVDLEPGHPPIRLNAAIFNNQNGLGLDRGTPTNLHPLLQRTGTHRLTIFVSGLRADGKRINETFLLDIEWSGPTEGAVIQSLRRM